MRREREINFFPLEHFREREFVSVSAAPSIKQPSFASLDIFGLRVFLEVRWHCVKFNVMIVNVVSAISTTGPGAVQVILFHIVDWPWSRAQATMQSGH